MAVGLQSSGVLQINQDADSVSSLQAGTASVDGLTASTITITPEPGDSAIVLDTPGVYNDSSVSITTDASSVVTSISASFTVSGVADEITQITTTQSLPVGTLIAPAGLAAGISQNTTTSFNEELGVTVTATGGAAAATGDFTFSATLTEALPTGITVNIHGDNGTLFGTITTSSTTSITVTFTDIYGTAESLDPVTTNGIITINTLQVVEVLSVVSADVYEVSGPLGLLPSDSVNFASLGLAEESAFVFEGNLQTATICEVTTGFTTTPRYTMRGARSQCEILGSAPTITEVAGEAKGVGTIYRVREVHPSLGTAIRDRLEWLIGNDDEPKELRITYDGFALGGQGPLSFDGKIVGYQRFSSLGAHVIHYYLDFGTDIPSPTDGFVHMRQLYPPIVTYGISADTETQFKGEYITISGEDLSTGQGDVVVNTDIFIEGEVNSDGITTGNLNIVDGDITLDGEMIVSDGDSSATYGPNGGTPGNFNTASLSAAGDLSVNTVTALTTGALYDLPESPSNGNWVTVVNTGVVNGVAVVVRSTDGAPIVGTDEDFVGIAVASATFVYINSTIGWAII